jgi:hypothetical protein
MTRLARAHGLNPSYDAAGSVTRPHGASRTLHAARRKPQAVA